MATKQQLVTMESRDGADMMEFDLPVYAARFLRTMCIRERVRLTNLSALGAEIELSLDALSQIERALA